MPVPTLASRLRRAATCIRNKLQPLGSLQADSEDQARAFRVDGHHTDSVRECTSYACCRRVCVTYPNHPSNCESPRARERTLCEALLHLIRRVAADYALLAKFLRFNHVHRIIGSRREIDSTWEGDLRQRYDVHNARLTISAARTSSFGGESLRSRSAVCHALAWCQPAPWGSQR